MENQNAIMLDLDDEDNDVGKYNHQTTVGDEMLLLSSSSSDEEESMIHQAGPSGLKTQPGIIDLNASNIIIDDSDSEDSFANSVEVIGSDDDEDLDDSESDSDNSHSSFLDGKVQIFMAQGAFFIWNAEDVQMLREECRIVGKLVGCLPRAPRQNNQLGLPLQLMPEEAKLLEEIEAACVVEESVVPVDIEELRKTAFERMREDNYRQQLVMFKESRKAEILLNKDKIIAGKRAKKRKQEELETNQGTSEKTDSTSKIVKLNDTQTAEQANIPDMKQEDSREEEMERDSPKRDTVDTGSNDTSTAEGEKRVCEGDRGIISDSKEKETAAVATLIAVDSSKGNTEEGSNPLQSDCTPLMSDNAASTVSDADQVPQSSSSAELGKEENKDLKKEECVVIDLDNDHDEKDRGRDDDVADDDDDNDEEEDFNVDDIATSETDIKHSLVQLFTENPWKGSVKRPKHWIFPLSQKEFLRYQVFRDLWRKGYFLTSGSKFGGDFLVYPGDPARFHSHFIAVCVDKTVDLSALDVISLGRLGSNVRKTVLLCAFNKFRQIVYTSLQWTGIS